MITVISRPACSACRATLRWLLRRDVTPRILDAEEPEAQDLQGSFTTAPIVVVTGHDGTVIERWCGFRPDRLDQAVTEGVAA